MMFIIYINSHISNGFFNNFNFDLLLNDIFKLINFNFINSNNLNVRINNNFTKLII